MQTLVFCMVLREIFLTDIDRASLMSTFTHAHNKTCARDTLSAGVREMRVAPHEIIWNGEPIR